MTPQEYHRFCGRRRADRFGDRLACGRGPARRAGVRTERTARSCLEERLGCEGSEERVLSLLSAASGHPVSGCALDLLRLAARECG